MMNNTNKIKDSFGKYLSEIIVIFLGISISFWFDEWRDDRKDRETEHKILINLKENLAQDTMVLGGTVQNGEIFVKGINQLISLKSDIAPDSLNLFIDMAASYTGFLSNQTTYEEIKQTGHTSLIQDDTLKKAILAHYTTLVPYVNAWCEIDKNQIINHLIPEMSNHFPVVIDSLNTVSTNEKIKALKLLKIRNILVTNKVYKIEAMKVLNMANSNSKKLIARIDKILKK